MSFQLWVARIFDNSVRATAWLHIPTDFGNDLDVGVLGEDLLRRLGPERVHRCSRHAGDQHDLALAVELLHQPLGRDATCLLLIDRDVVGARLGDFRIIGKHQHALVAGILDRGVERIGRDRKDYDGLGAGLHHGIDLLDLALRIRAGDLDFEVDLVAHALVAGHRLDHVGGLGLPVIADITHRQEDLESVGCRRCLSRELRNGKQRAQHDKRWKPRPTHEILPIGYRFVGGTATRGFQGRALR